MFKIAKLPLQGPQVRSQVGELKSCVPCRQRQKIEKQTNNDLKLSPVRNSRTHKSGPLAQCAQIHSRSPRVFLISL